MRPDPDIEQRRRFHVQLRLEQFGLRRLSPQQIESPVVQQCALAIAMEMHSRGLYRSKADVALQRICLEMMRA